MISVSDATLAVNIFRLRQLICDVACNVMVVFVAVRIVDGTQTVVYAAALQIKEVSFMITPFLVFWLRLLLTFAYYKGY